VNRFLSSGKFINQEMYVYYLVSLDNNGMAVHLTRTDCEGF